MDLAENQLTQPVGVKSEEALRQQALEIYKRLPVARISYVARRLGLSKEAVLRWQEEDSWLQERADFQREQQEDLLRPALKLRAVVERLIDRLDEISQNQAIGLTSLSGLARIARDLNALREQLLRKIRI